MKRRNIFRKSGLSFIKAGLLPVFFTGIIIAMVISGLRQTQRSSDSEGLRILEESIRRAVVMNYAIEGRYPVSIEYVQERYGIHIDKSRYAVHYAVMASNIMPDILVYEINIRN